MKKIIQVHFYFCLMFIPFVADAQQKSNDSFNLQLAYRWAPIHYQDTDNTNAKADYISKFDYDGNFFGNDNWDNLDKGNLSAYAYYSVVETSTHWFIIYMFYHPRDWTDGSFDNEHENDAEGLLTIIKKGATTYGSFVAMFTTPHGGINSYVPQNSTLTRNNSVFSGSNFNGKVSFKNYDGALHPTTVQHAKSHAIYAFPSGDFSGKPNEDGIIYYPSKTLSELPSSGNDRNVKYQLINIFDFNLWTLQLFESAQTSSHNTYHTWGSFIGDKTGGCGNGSTVLCTTNAASPPWGWAFSNYEKYRGLLALDPAKTVNDYFKGLGNFSLIYSTNKYLVDLEKSGFTDTNLPYGWPTNQKISYLYEKIANKLSLKDNVNTDDTVFWKNKNTISHLSMLPICISKAKSPNGVLHLLNNSNNFTVL
jgi:hypothetical protein